jgi:hypothetical protein
MIYFSLTRPVSAASFPLVKERINSELSRPAEDVEEQADSISYDISPFAPGIRYSRFGAFNRIRISTDDARSQVTIKFQVSGGVLLLPLLLSVFAILIALKHRDGLQGLPLLIFVPLALFAVLMLLYYVRVRSWFSYITY